MPTNRVLRFGILILMVGLGIGLLLYQGSSATAQASRQWLTYTDQRFDFTIQYPTDWVVTPRPDDDNPRAHGAVLTFAPAGETTKKVVIGLRGVPRDPAEPLDKWTDSYTEDSMVFAPSQVTIHSREYTPFSAADGGQVFMVNGVSPLTEYRFANIPWGKTVWFVWTNLDTQESGIFTHMVMSLRLGRNTPRTLQDAYGPDFNPTTWEPHSSQGVSDSDLSTQMVASLPWGWYAPVPANSNWSVNCGSSYHTGTLAYATDISMVNGTSVHNSKRSWVDFAGWNDQGYGNLVITCTDFTYPDAYTLYYAHLQSDVVTEGQEVGARSLIAYADNTGNSTGSHLHFHVVKNGVEAVDLRTLINFYENSNYPSVYAYCGYMRRP